MLQRNKTAWSLSELVPTDNSTKGPSILIIDDEPDICKLLQLTLVRHGYSVRYVHELGLGMQDILKHQPDLLFLDIHLPDGSGLEALPIIKEKCPTLPVITISAYDNALEKQTALKAGATFFLAKPFSVKHVDELIDHIRI
ncbi:response regulator [Chitinophaga silvatica]|uniref:Response regulator n=1 Tax=Chitinophaga silvatica TaxID=2282649 RepID=A0A3E1YCS3_9BACT|nr:response regulator [Chitinophaga silvatica]RFS24046.1 response regulator [Chitinophaga silvatica]